MTHDIKREKYLLFVALYSTNIAEMLLSDNLIVPISTDLVWVEKYENVTMIKLNQIEPNAYLSLPSRACARVSYASTV